MNSINIRLLIILMIGAVLSCDKIFPGTEEPVIVDVKPMGILDMAFIYRVQGIPSDRLKKVDLCLANTADNLYKGCFSFRLTFLMPLSITGLSCLLLIIFIMPR